MPTFVERLQHLRTNKNITQKQLADYNLVGFIMMGYYEKKRQYTLWRFIINKKYQGKGYGKSALKLAVNYMIYKPWSKA